MAKKLLELFSICMDMDVRLCVGVQSENIVYIVILYSGRARKKVFGYIKSSIRN